jgi:hypothetical protein
MGDNDETKRADFEHEVQVLSSLRCLNHPNIIRLITAYAKGDEYNFLLPVADGDLSALLLSSNSGTLFSTRDDILASLWGLSSAIEAVHMFFADEYNKLAATMISSPKIFFVWVVNLFFPTLAFLGYGQKKKALGPCLR